jgi:ATP-dependent DNA helicase PIF1
MNPEQKLALEDVQKGQNIFITGGAGVGKSYLVKEIATGIKKRIGICAMTGCAAQLIDGATLHSYLGIGLAKQPAKVLANTIIHKLFAVSERIVDLEVLLIDEVSMLNDELLEKVYEVLQLVRRNSKPFGGVQMIFVGDPFQLAPVEGNYCFTSKLWKDIKVHTLTQNMRQAGDQAFKDLLDRVRWGKCSPEDLATLQKLKETTFPDDIIPTKLYSKNINVDAINRMELDKLTTKSYEYGTDYSSDYSKKWATSNKIPEKSILKVGAQIMCTRNIPVLGLANGSRGVVTNLEPRAVYIRKLTGETVCLPYIEVSPFDNPRTIVNFLPIKLAWAVTIHSSQGMTIDALEVDLGKDIFACGQAYTGLSRAKSLSSVRVTSVLSSSFVSNPIIKKLFEA